jgi:hypothetical protein
MDDFKYNHVLLIDDSYIDNRINKQILINEKFAESITSIETPKEAFELKQRLKKSTSMRNLIEQRFMYGS